MQRNFVYPASIPQDVDILAPQQNAMIGIGYLAQSVFGTNSVAAIGLACTPTGPASMTVNVGPGTITGYSEIDPNAYGSLGTNTNPLLKMGINQTSTAFTLTAPSTSGQSINYLIEATFQETDGTPVVLPYLNPSNPAQPYSGPSNSGATQNTVRAQIVGLQLLAGASATTGTQTTPAVTSGWSPLYVITVNYGQTMVTSSSISVAANSPFVGGSQVTTGRLINVQTFTSSGIYTPTPGTNSIIIEMVGGGGAGGGAIAPGSSSTTAGGGGASGSYGKGRYTTGFSGATVTIGAGGTPGAIGTSGGNGGASSFGSLMTVPGGAGSTPGQANAGYSWTYGYALPGGVPTGGNILNANGKAGGYGFGQSTGQWLSGEGGASAFGAGAPALASATGTGNAATNPGSGGGGASCAVSATSRAGGAGAAGMTIVWEIS